MFRKFSSLEVDVLIKKGNQFIDIDLVGYPRDRVEAFNLEQYSMLNRAVFKMSSLPYSYWKLNREIILRELDKL
ncbi:hypothetical protein N9Q76_01875 [Flavobacteriales bacterium]|nr:hypothetical protein [Flavobacteriales bacterium]